MKFLSGLGAVSGSSSDDTEADTTDGTDVDTHSADLSVDLRPAYEAPQTRQWIDLIENERRRFVIDHLRAGHIGSKRDLARALAAAVDTEYKNAYVSLHQTHLEPLADLGVIADADAEPIEPGPEFETACALIDAVREVVGVDYWASQYDTERGV